MLCSISKILSSFMTCMICSAMSLNSSKSRTPFSSLLKREKTVLSLGLSRLRSDAVRQLIEADGFALALQRADNFEYEGVFSTFSMARRARSSSEILIQSNSTITKSTSIVEAICRTNNHRNCWQWRQANGAVEYRLKYLGNILCHKTILQLNSKRFIHLMKIILCTFLCALVLSQNIGKVKPDLNISSPYTECTAQGCSIKQGAFTIAAEWRWLHYVSNYDGCQNAGGWDARYCPDPITCAKNCGYEGVSGPSEYKSTYGVLPVSDGIRLNYVTNQNVGSRVHFLQSENKYRVFKLINRQFSFDVDMSTLECGMNGAVYFVQMDSDGGSAKYPTNKAGAKYGTGYCDAQCGTTPFVAGQATSSKWGTYGACCAEFDLWQANKQAHAYAAHPCIKPGYYRCSGNTECGFKDQRYNGVCDGDGCLLNPFRNGNKLFYGPGKNYSVDTTKPFTVVTQFLTKDGTDKGDLSEIRRFYVQNGKKIPFPKTNISGMAAFDSMTDKNCQAQISKFRDANKYLTAGGTKAMGDALRRGMVLIVSLWDDYSYRMQWLDGTTPPNADPKVPGVMRGPCPKDAGDPNNLRRNYPNAYFSVTKIRYGSIGSTTKFGQRVRQMRKGDY